MNCRQGRRGVEREEKACGGGGGGLLQFYTNFAAIKIQLLA